MDDSFDAHRKGELKRLRGKILTVLTDDVVNDQLDTFTDKLREMVENTGGLEDFPFVFCVYGLCSGCMEFHGLMGTTGNVISGMGEVVEIMKTASEQLHSMNMVPVSVFVSLDATAYKFNDFDRKEGEGIIAVRGLSVDHRGVSSVLGIAEDRQSVTDEERCYVGKEKGITDFGKLDGVLETIFISAAHELKDVAERVMKGEEPDPENEGEVRMFEGMQSALDSMREQYGGLTNEQIFDLLTSEKTDTDSGNNRGG
jgi:hypothetical protein